MTTYRVHGICDDTDTCEVCGKVELKRVVMLMALDADGNDDEIIYAGTSCAARKIAATAGRTVKGTRIRDAAEAAGRVMAEARAFAAEFAGITEAEYFAANAVAVDNFGADLVRTRYAETLGEVATINSGTVVGTRFERRLPII